MFDIQFKRWVPIGLIAAAWLAAGAFDAAAQQDMTSYRRNFTRAHMWSSFQNNGLFGSAWGLWGEGMYWHSYPGIGAGSQSRARSDWYWDLKPSGWGGGNEATFISVMRSYVVLTTVGGEPYDSHGQKVTEDLKARVYDIENGPEATWGIDTKAPARATAADVGKSTANWWPGATSFIDGDPTATVPYEIHNYDYGVYPPVQNTAEAVLISEWSSNEHGGENVLTAVRRVLGWSNQDLDDMLVYDTEWTNTSNEQITNAWFGYTQGVHLKSNGHKSRGGYSYGFVLWGGRRSATEYDDRFAWSEDPGFAGNPNFVGRHWMLQWDGDDAFSLDDDTGDPFWVNLCGHLGGRSCADISVGGFLNSTARPDGMPQSPDHIATGALAWRSSGTGAWNAKDAAAGYVDPQGEPLWHHWAIHRAQYFLDWYDPAMVPEGFAKGPKTVEGRYAAWTEGGSHEQPSIASSGSTDIMFGPYTLDPGDKVKLVLANVAGLGAHITTNPDNGYPYDPIEWAWQVGEQYGSLSDAPARNAELAKGHDGAWTNVEHALFAYSNEWQVPTTPPDVDFQISSTLEAQTELTWNGDAERAVNPDYGTADVTAYRVYVSTWSEAGPWRLKGTMPASGASSYSWVDKESLAGFSRFYNVRSVASGKSDWSEGTKTLADLPAQMAAHVTNGLEGGYSAPEQRTFDNIVPSQPADPKSDNLDLEVRVVPNPLNVFDGSQNYNGEVKVRFVGIPYKAKISIYSVGGDLVSTLYHNNPESGEADFRLLNNTVSGQIYSGVYVWVVESLVSTGAKPQSGYLVIHR